MLLSAVAIRHDRLEPSTIIGANLDLDPLAHAAIVPRPLASQDSFDCIGALVSRIDGEGRVTNGPLVPIDTSQGKPSELCWLQITSDNSLVLATNFGYGTASTYRLAEGRLSLLQDPANEAIPGDGTFRAVNGLVSSGPSALMQS